MIVDDEPAILQLVSILLRGSYALLTAGNGDEALAMLRTHRVDLVLSDHKMPGMTGVELLRHARDLQPHAVRILMTAFADLQTVIDAINLAGVNKFVQKPWDPDHLVGVIHGSFIVGCGEAAAPMPGGLPVDAFEPIHDLG